MKIAVFSDTHGNWPLVANALELAGPVDEIIHLGDETEDAFLLESLSGREVKKVLGNCDHRGDQPREALLLIHGKKFLLTHGDRYGVKGGLQKLRKRAEDEKADVVLYGHTHIKSILTINGVLYVNPGCLKKDFSEPSFALISLEDGEISAMIVNLQPSCPSSPFDP